MKRYAVWMISLLAALVLSGCSAVKLTLNPQELYALPKLPERYTELNKQISAILESGAEYAVPTAGSNIQPVQMTDLDGDGKEEAVAFFRKVDDEKPLKICVFTAAGAGYQLSTQIEGSGAAFNSIAYNDLDGDGKVEMIVGWRVSTELQALSVYALREQEAEELIHADYVKYLIADLNGDAKRELITLRTDQEGLGTAECYGWNSGTLALDTSARVSMTMAELSRQGRLTAGKLADETPALFVTGVTDGMRAVTDVLILGEDGLKNIALSDVTGVTKSIAVYRGLYPADVNGDGITEIPYPQRLPDWDDDSDASYRIDWKACHGNGSEELVLTTYHDMEQGWYLKLPAAWQDQILVNWGSSSEQTYVTFYIFNKTGKAYQPFLKITALSGTNRERQALLTGRFTLRRQNDVIYVAELLKANEEWQYGVTEDQVREAFSLIAREWTASDA